MSAEGDGSSETRRNGASAGRRVTGNKKKVKGAAAMGRFKWKEREEGGVEDAVGTQRHWQTLYPSVFLQGTNRESQRTSYLGSAATHKHTIKASWNTATHITSPQHWRFALKLPFVQPFLRLLPLFPSRTDKWLGHSTCSQADGANWIQNQHFSALLTRYTC